MDVQPKTNCIFVGNKGIHSFARQPRRVMIGENTLLCIRVSAPYSRGRRPNTETPPLTLKT